MRLAASLIVAAMLAACASASGGTSDEHLGQLPFPVERGSALPPPAPAASDRAAPPEGAGAAGLDFARWRSADPAAYASAFQTQVAARYANQEVAYVRADLEANGFACEGSAPLQCRIEIMERPCTYDWYVVVERARAEPVAGFDKLCASAG